MRIWQRLTRHVVGVGKVRTEAEWVLEFKKKCGRKWPNREKYFVLKTSKIVETTKV